jgi:hypothetical protein
MLLGWMKGVWVVAIFPFMTDLTPQIKDQIWELCKLPSISILVIHPEMRNDHQVNLWTWCVQYKSQLSIDSNYYLDPILPVMMLGLKD